MSELTFAFNRALQLAPFIKAFTDRGGEVGAIFRRNHILPNALTDPKVLVTGDALYGAVADMADQLEDPYFAARVMEGLAENGTAMVRDAYFDAHTLGEFFALAIPELGRQISNLIYSITIAPKRTTWNCDRTFVPVTPIVQPDAAVVCAWVALLKKTVGEDYDASRVLVGVQANSGIPSDSLPPSSIILRKKNSIEFSFPTEWLKKPFNAEWKYPKGVRGEFAGNSKFDEIHEYLLAICDAHLDQQEFGIEAFSAFCGANTRKVQRLLKSRGTSFSQLRDVARRRRAQEMVKNNQYKLEQIAASVGLSGVPSLCRAFRRWTGMSPAEFMDA